MAPVYPVSELLEFLEGSFTHSPSTVNLLKRAFESVGLNGIVFAKRAAWLQSDTDKY